MNGTFMRLFIHGVGTGRSSAGSRSARIHPHNASTPQKSISGQLGAIPFKNYLSNCGIVAIGLTVDARWTASSTMTISAASRDVESKELQNADLQFGPLSH
jgi:hypothetical protein